MSRRVLWVSVEFPKSGFTKFRGFGAFYYTWPRGSMGVQRYGVYPAECGEQLGRDSQKNGSSKSLVLKSFWVERTFWDSALLVSLTIEFGIRLYFFTPPTSLPPNTFPRKTDKTCWSAANGGVTNGGLRGVWPPVPEIGRNRPFFCLFRPFPEGPETRAPENSKENHQKGKDLVCLPNP